MVRQPLQVAVILGSVRSGRFAPTAADWFVGQIRERDDMTADVVDLAEVALPMAMPASGSPPSTEAASALANSA